MMCDAVSMAMKSSPRKASATPRVKRAKPTMSAEHKQALAVGREESRAVRRYLEALQAHKPKRGRKRTSESIKGRLDQIERRLPTADPLSRVHMVQERLNLQSELAAKDDTVDLASLEEGFVKSARRYGERKHL